MKGEKMLVEDEHSISVLVEEILFPRLRAYDEDERINPKEKEKKKDKVIETFVKEYSKKSTLLSEEQIRQLVNKVIQRTYKNIVGEDR